ncbi:3'(2'),5'-bisphosphate nucleotidase [Alkalicoccus urumqiensis]|uniref:3'(2'),5'-bisphosphate nucleotidase CysQ n=2 Tax=Alkalicoccus urumqiensis TaxID=1548213 RepID=A0A2P6MGT9_ALKUR|nr:3'(2'),5'-bisphosphate nucleotidase [Alkalicoccus urumqiensis]
MIELSIAAGQAIMEIYDEEDMEVERKQDDSPLTKADKQAHELLFQGLRMFAPDIPVLSEEGDHPAYTTRRSWDRCFVVDPLDGTKEFLKRNGEFTVNTALVENGVPVLGVIYAPALDLLYFADINEGSFKAEQASLKSWSSDAVFRLGYPLPLETTNELTALVSRSHPSEETQQMLAKLEEAYGSLQKANVGSSLKLCYIAEGKADIYPRMVPTMEWDTAAGQAIVEAAGGEVLVYPSGEKLMYNKEDLKNPYFTAKRKTISLPKGVFHNDR